MSEHLGSVLLVDDDVDARTMLSMLLSSHDMTVVEAGSGEEALAAIEESVPGLVLLDFDMPGIDGGETLRRIRQNYSEDRLPVVMVSNRQDSDTIVEALDQGANDYVTKSTDPAVLQARIRRHLIHRRLPECEKGPFGGTVGPYRLGSELGQGPMAVTYRAVDSRTDVTRAIRILKPGYRVDLETFHSWELFEHNLLADLVDAGTEPVHYLVYELVEGASTEELVTERGALPRKEALSYALTVAQATQAVHDLGRVHGELRPSNVRVREGNAVVLDFGFSALLQRENPLVRSDELSGHPAYLAPEVLTRDGEKDTGGDIYAVGAILFTLATGRLPFEGSVAEVVHKVLHEKPPKPSGLREDRDRVFDFVCSRLMSKDPKKRYTTMADVVQKLSELLDEPQS